MINWKVVLWSGIGGFLLSFFVGIIGGILIGTLFVRALLWGLLFSFLGGGIYFVISRYLPDMFANRAQAPEGGGAVDIVLPEENPHLASDEEEEPFEAEDAVDEITAGDAGDLVEEVEESAINSPRPAVGGQSGGEVEESEEQDSFFSSAGEEEGGLPEELPELDGEAFEGGRSPSESPPPRSSVRDSAGALGGADPAEIARAIRTALRKDQKG